MNAVMYYTPTILMAAGGSFLKELGLSSESSSILASLLATSVMLPFIFLAMKLMDKCGRRYDINPPLERRVFFMVMAVHVTAMCANAGSSFF